MTTDSIGSIVALDIGARRIGVARASLAARLAEPLTTLANTEATPAALARLLSDNKAQLLVVGLPRGLDGQETSQTQAVQDFIGSLGDLKVPIHWQDEALTSRQAEAELQSRGKVYVKGDIDALAATYILEDFLRGQSGQPSEATA